MVVTDVTTYVAAGHEMTYVAVIVMPPASAKMTQASVLHPDGPLGMIAGAVTVMFAEAVIE